MQNDERLASQTTHPSRIISPQKKKTFIFFRHICLGIKSQTTLHDPSKYPSTATPEVYNAVLSFILFSLISFVHSFFIFSTFFHPFFSLAIFFIRDFIINLAFLYVYVFFIIFFLLLFRTLIFSSAFESFLFYLLSLH